MKVMNMVGAINDALDIKLKEDKNVIVFGEDVGVGIVTGKQKRVQVRVL